MPSTSVAQQRLMQIAEHHPSAVSPANRGVLEMNHQQLHDFAAGSEADKPEHAHEHGKNLGHFLHGKGGTTTLKAHAVAHGHAPHAEAYAAGALAQRKGEHAHRGTHHGALTHAASSHGYSGAHADAYAAGATNEMNGAHAEQAAPTPDESAEPV